MVRLLRIIYTLYIKMLINIWQSLPIINSNLKNLWVAISRLTENTPYDIFDTILTPSMFAFIDILHTSSEGRISSISSGHSIKHKPSVL